MGDDQDYLILGLKSGASPEDVRQAYRDLVNVWHPDRFAHDPRLQIKAQEKMKQINEAYDRLQNAFPKVRTPQDTPKPPPPREPEPEIHEPSRLWAWFLVAFAIGFGLFWSSLPRGGSQAGSERPPEPYSVAITNTKPKLPPLQPALDDPNALTPQEILERRRKTAQQWGGSADSRTMPLPEGSGAKTSGAFTVGSSKEEVIALQGPPDSGGSNMFTYGTSHVYFEDGLVTGWESRSPRLKARLKPRVRSNASSFTVGSTRDEVLSVQGSPDSFSERDFIYGAATIHFEGDRVTSWYDPDNLLKVRMLPGAQR